MIPARTRSISWALQEADMWLEGFRRFWSQRLDALATEIARGKRQRRTAHGQGSASSSTPATGDEDEEST